MAYFDERSEAIEICTIHLSDKSNLQENRKSGMFIFKLRISVAKHAALIRAHDLMS